MKLALQIHRIRKFATDSNDALHSLDIQHAGHAFDGVDHFVQVLHVEDFDGHLDVSPLVGATEARASRMPVFMSEMAPVMPAIMPVRFSVIASSLTA